MANAYSKLHNYQQELYKPNLELINTALQFKQGTLNANRSKLQTMYDQYSFLDVAKEEDQEYLEGRLQATRTIMDKYSSLDLSSNSLTNQLTSNMSNVIDDNVKNAVISTRIYQSEQSSWNKLKEENPEKYSQTNHAYSKQGADAWLNDGATGSTYNGGGGVIEYVDVQGKLAKEIPAIAKSIKAEWVELAAGGGYFRDVVTKERVSRGRLESAMDGLLNEQDRRQMQINAWGTYDGMSEQQLEAAYTSHFSPKTIALEGEIASLERTIDTTKDPALKAQRGELLEFYKEQLGAYEANSFENIVQNYGKEAAYSTLYDNQFRSNYLDAYSYTDRITKIAVYDNDVKQRNYEHKLDRLTFDREKEAFNQQIKVAELDIKERELALKGTGGAAGSQGAKPGEPGYVPPLVGTEAVVEYENAVSKIEEHQKRNKEIVKETKNLFGIEGDAQLRDLSEVFNKGFAGKEFIEFNGKKVNVEENLELLLDYQNNILSESAIEVEAMGEFNKAVDKSLFTLKKLAQGDSPDWKAEESTPRFNFKFEVDKETGTMKRVPVAESTLNPYAHLLGKEVLSEEEKFTLGVYHKMHLLMDPELADAQKELIFKDLQTNQFSQLTNEDYAAFPEDIHAYNRMSTRKDKSGGGGGAGLVHLEGDVSEQAYELMKEEGVDKKYGDYFLFKPDPIAGTRIQTYKGYEGIITDLANAYKGYANASEKNQPAYREKINSLTAILDVDNTTLTTHQNTSSLYTTDYYISDITEGDAEYYDKNGDEISMKSPSDIITEGMDLYANTLEQDYKNRSPEPSLYPQIFNTESSGYDKLITLIGLPAGSKEPITLTRVWDEETKQPTNEVSWTYKDGDEVVSSEEAGNVLKVDQLRNNGVIDFSSNQRTSYNASWGETAPTLNLGNNTYDEKIKKDNVSRYGSNLALSVENTKPLLDDARKFGGEELFTKVKEERKAFKEGAYEFKLESIDGLWQYAIYNNTGKRVYNEYTEETGAIDYSNQEVGGIFSNSEFIINTVMYNYLYSKVEDASEEYILNYQEGQETNLK